MSEFSDDLIQLAKRVAERQHLCQGEEQTKLSLVLPFLRLLGHDPADPAEVAPEHIASFDTRHCYRADFAIMFDGVPTIAVECKAAGKISQHTAGQLRGYFNAIESVKLGIATDGIVYELFADSDSPNLMDSKPFFRFDMTDFARGVLDEQTIATIEGLTRGRFDAGKIGAEARRGLVSKALYDQFASMWDAPPEDLVRYLLKRADIGRVGAGALRQYADLVPEAFRRFVQDRLVQSLNPRGEPIAEESADEAETNGEFETDGQEIVTTQRELDFFQECKNRLYYLCKDDDLFAKISNVDFRDYKGKFVIFYKTPRRGRLLDLIDDDTAYRVRMFDQDAFVKTGGPAEFSTQLIDTFRRRVAELG